jgi:hypothetical protein
MTTIAYRHGEMACDSCWTENGFQVTSMIKIVRLSSGALLGTAGDGDTRDITDLLDKVKSPEKLPTRAALRELRTDISALWVPQRGGIYEISSGPLGPEFDHFDAQVTPYNYLGFAAVGSGREFALGAMAVGPNVTAKDAVRSACVFDICSKLPVHVVQLKKQSGSKTYSRT